MNKLFRQIRREAARSPQKAAVLGLLALVAVWFWVPLMLDWIRGDGQKKANAATEETFPAGLEFATAHNPMAATAPDAQPQEEVPSDWQEVVTWLQEDPLTHAAEPIASSRDPFVTVDFPPVHPSLLHPVQEETQEETGQLPEWTPKQIGLTLTSTLVGPGQKLALISGKAYHPQDTIVATHASQQIEFTLAEVHLRHAVLLREGKTYELRIPRQDGSDRVAPNTSTEQSNEQ